MAKFDEVVTGPVKRDKKKGVIIMGMISEKMTMNAVYVGQKPMKGKPWLFFAKDNNGAPDFIKIKVNGAVLGVPAFGKAVLVTVKNCELKFSQFENSMYEAESISLVVEEESKQKAA